MPQHIQLDVESFQEFALPSDFAIPSRFLPRVSLLQPPSRELPWRGRRNVLNGRRIVSVTDTNIPANLPSFLSIKSMIVQLLVE